ncbi:MAG TPA: hypothetical protein DET40_22435 [Lentisphaeria bacterium]|nr:MAG: hypothetical protein A2X45_24715 [Lentisphaerae bacterium GWF2_50_93]HCE46313.1 hypothetical protein [Lentisphaeria bacterium]
MSIPSNIDLFAKTLSTMTQLAYLSIPDEFAGELTPGLLPSSIKILEFPGQELSKFDKDIVFPSVERIIAGKTRLESFNVPKLLHLDLHLDKNMGKHIGKFHLLNTLNIQSFRDSTFLADIPSEQLVFLGIRGNSPHSWEFLRNLTCLRGLWIQNIGGCFDLSNLHFCSALEELTLGYCEIQYPEHLLNLSHLKAIHLFGCKANSDITKQLDELKEKGVSVFSSGL